MTPPRALTVGGTSAEVLLPLGIGALLAAIALRAGGGLQLKPTTEVEMALLLGGGVVAAGALLRRRDRRAAYGDAGAAVLRGARRADDRESILWSVEPVGLVAGGEPHARPTSVVFGVAIAFARFAPQRWAALLGGTVVASTIVCGYALLTKVFPGSLDPDEVYARLREPFGYWNAVGLMAALGAPRLPVARRAARRPRARSTRSPTRRSACCSSDAAAGLLARRAAGAADRPRRSGSRSCRCGCAASRCWRRARPARCVVASGRSPRTALSKDRHAASTSARPPGHELGVLLVVLIALLLAAGLAIGFAAARARAAPRHRAAPRASRSSSRSRSSRSRAPSRWRSPTRGLGGSISHGWKQLTDPHASTPAERPRAA